MAKFAARQKLALVVGLFAAGVAVASPWDVDMIDARALKAYGWRMMPAAAEGTATRPDYGQLRRPLPAGHYQNDYIAPTDRAAVGNDNLVNPYAGGAGQEATGEALFRATCAPCHGIEGKGRGPVVQFDPAKGLNRVPMPAPNLSGDGAVTPSRSDGYLYDTIRNGGASRSGGMGMPKYGVLLTDKERWAIVSYIRTLDGATYTPSATPAAGSPP